MSFILIKLKKLTLEGKNQLIFSSAYGVVSITLTLLLFLRVMVQITDERKYKNCQLCEST